MEGKDDGLRSLAEYVLRGINHPIGVAGYRLGDVLLGDFAKYLPSPEDLQNWMQEQSRRAGVGSFFWRTATRSKKWMAQGRCVPAREVHFSRANAYRKLFLRRVGGPSNGKCVGFDFGHRRELSSIEWGYARAAESSQVFADIYAEKMSGMPIMHGFFLCWPFVFGALVKMP